MVQTLQSMLSSEGFGLSGVPSRLHRDIQVQSITVSILRVLSSFYSRCHRERSYFDRCFDPCRGPRFVILWVSSMLSSLPGIQFILFPIQLPARGTGKQLKRNIGVFLGTSFILSNPPPSNCHETEASELRRAGACMQLGIKAISH